VQAEVLPAEILGVMFLVAEVFTVKA
jgi:hypothetical protein